MLGPYLSSSSGHRAWYVLTPSNSAVSGAEEEITTVLLTVDGMKSFHSHDSLSGTFTYI